jgi:hypothetical protein
MCNELPLLHAQLADMEDAAKKCNSLHGVRIQQIIEDIRAAIARDGAVAERSAARSEHQLLPCPFCGAECSLFSSSDHSTAWEGGCPDEDCPAHDCLWFVSEAGAIAAWNRRSEHQSAGRDSVLEEAAKLADDHTPAKHAGTLAAHVTGRTIAQAIRSLKQEGEQADGRIFC